MMKVVIMKVITRPYMETKKQKIWTMLFIVIYIIHVMNIYNVKGMMVMV